MSHLKPSLREIILKAEVIKVVITMKDYKEIRQRYLAGESQRTIAKAMHISRNTVAKYCQGDSVPWERKQYERDNGVLTPDIIQFIQSCLDEDQDEGLKKQTHTAKRIYDRLVEEKGFSGGESTVRRKVKELRSDFPKAFVPLQSDPGDALQVDWGEATVYLANTRITINIFCARLCYSCRPIVLAYRRQNEESFLDAFVHVFDILNGVPKRVIFDNGRVAVKKGFGKQAEKQAGYASLSAHYGFDAIFCNPAEGHEKGLVEGLVGWARRNILVPVPHIDSVEELNALLLERCLKYEQHKIQGKPSAVGEMFREEQSKLMPLPGYRFEIAKCMNVRVSSFSLVRYQTNSYSVPVEYVGRHVGLKAYPEAIEIYCDGKLISWHPRALGKEQTSYHLQDYLPLLERRPRAVLNAAPVLQTVPPEVLEQLRQYQDDREKTRDVLYASVGLPTPDNTQVKIEDPVHIQTVDLHQYDLLVSGKEAVQ